MRNQLLIVRGLPGSGKSTFAKQVSQLPNWKHVEADMYFVTAGGYSYDRERIGEAHEWCRWQTHEALNQGYNVVVANTFTRDWEIDPYKVMCDNLSVVTMVGQHGSIHDIPQITYDKMKRRFQEMHCVRRD